MDFTNLLKVAKSSFVDADAPKAVDENALANWMEQTVRRMSAAGYDFDRKSLEALEHYGRGYAIAITGVVGIGKTMFFRKLNPDIIIADMNLISRWKFDDVGNFLDNHAGDEMVIDDLGTGTAKGNDWGSPYDVLMVMLNVRLRSRKRTHFTTNLANDQLIAAYDYRAVDRIYGMAKFVTFTPRESRRMPTQFFNH